MYSHRKRFSFEYRITIRKSTECKGGVSAPSKIGSTNEESLSSRLSTTYFLKLTSKWYEQIFQSFVMILLK